MDFDLNLLRILVALEQSRSVTRAAEILGMSQSGFSTALMRLRRAFNDELFVRTPEGMAPTPRAIEMARTASAVLENVRSGILEAPAFEPSMAQTEFRVVMTDIGEIVFMPRLVPFLRQQAPLASVSCFPAPAGELEGVLERGEADLALGYYPDLSKETFFRQRLYSHTFVCLLRVDHPIKRMRLTEEDFCSLGHVIASAPARSHQLFDRFMESRGLQRHVVLRTPHLLALPMIIAASDLIATVPLAVGTVFARYGMVRLVRPPFDPPTFLVQQHWHRRVHKDPRNQWLRSSIAGLFNDAFDEWLEVERTLYGAIRQPSACG